MIYQMEIVVDTNDGDYEISVNDINEIALNKFRPLIEAIKNFKPYQNGSKWTHDHNFPNNEYVPRTDLDEMSVHELYSDFKHIIDDFIEYVPPCHTIVSIVVFPKPEKIKLL